MADLTRSIVRDGTAGGAQEESIPPIIVSNATATNAVDVDPEGMQHGSMLLLRGAGSNGLASLAALTDGDVVTIKNDTDDYLRWLENENATGLAANRFTLPKGFPAFLMPGDFIVLRYDGRTSRWEVLSWANQGPAMGMTEFSDFFSATGPFIGVSSGTSAQASSASTGVNTTEKAMGVTGLFTGTTNTGRCSIGSSGTNQLVPTLGPYLGVIRAAPVTAVDATETYAFYFGFHDFNNGTLTDGVAFEYRWDGVSAPELTTIRALATVVTRNATGMPTTPAAGEYQWYALFANAAGTRYDFIHSVDSTSFTKGVSLTTSLPSETQLTAFGATMIKSAGTTSRAYAVDLMGYRARNGGNRG
jgi:hypothetical protein